MKIRLVRDLETVPVSLRRRLRHQAGLQAHVRIAHFAIQFRLGNQRRNRVDNEYIDGARTHQCLGNLQRLLAVIRLGDQQIVDIHAQLACISGIQRVFRVNKCRQAAGLLRFRDNLQRDGGFAR